MTNDERRTTKVQYSIRRSSFVIRRALESQRAAQPPEKSRILRAADLLGLERALELLEQLALLLVQACWHHHARYHHLIAAAIAAQERHALAAQPEGCAGLRPRGDA